MGDCFGRCRASKQYQVEFRKPRLPWKRCQLRVETYKSAKVASFQELGTVLVLGIVVARHRQEIGVAGGLNPFFDVNEPVLDHIVFKADLELLLVELERVDQSLEGHLS